MDITERTKVPGNESSGSISLRGAKVTGSELAIVLLADSLLGANWLGRFAPGSKLARERKDCESFQRVWYATYVGKYSSCTDPRV